jgi:dipeptidyl aminopeptidase/acylaminoacyl peptidase
MQQDNVFCRFQWKFLKIATYLLVVISIGSLTGCGFPASYAQPLQDGLPPSTPIIPATEEATPDHAAETGEANPIPTCSFPLHSDNHAPPSDAISYTFAEPTVVITGTTVGLADWASSGHEVLISRRRDSLDSHEAIEIVDIDTGQTTVLGQRKELGTQPVWSDQLEQALFTDIVPDPSSSSTQINLYSSGGDVQSPLARNLATPYIAMSPDGQQIVLFMQQATTQPHIMPLGGFQVQSTPLSSQALHLQSEASSLKNLYQTPPPTASWHPNGSDVVVYGTEGFFFIDTTTGRSCRIDLDTDTATNLPWWALHAQWSPDGRYLALRLALGQEFPVITTRLALIDTQTGDLNLIELDAQMIYESDWGPDSQYLLTLGKVTTSHVGSPETGLFLTHVQTRDTQRVLPFDLFSTGSYFEGGGLLWSPDGTHVLVNCTTLEPEQLLATETRICEIEVGTS